MWIFLVLFESWLLQLLLSCLLTIINANNRILGSENMEDQSSLCWLIFFFTSKQRFEVKVLYVAGLLTMNILLQNMKVISYTLVTNRIKISFKN